MLVLFETPLGFCLFKFNEGKFSSDELWKEFETPERASAAYVDLPARQNPSSAQPMDSRADYHIILACSRYLIV